MIQHERAIEKYVARISQSPENLAVVISGSVARGNERGDSDVDLYLIVTEETWDAAFAAERLMYIETEGADYEHGYFDIKLATLSYLDEAAERGDDPVRDSFAHRRVVFSRVDDLEERLDRAATPPEGSWRGREASFLAQADLHGDYFLGQAHERGDRLLLLHAAVHLVTAASRLLLAHNRVLFQGPKYLTKTVASLPSIPDGWQDLVDAVLADPSPATAGPLLETLFEFADLGVSHAQLLSTFILDNELAWRYRTKTPEYS